MKTLRRICAVTILSLTLIGSALAGHIDTPAVTSGTAQTSSTLTTIVQTVISLIYS